MMRHRHQRIVIGLELEAYTIETPEYSIGRQMAFPRKGVGEKGERFARDWSIGTEYNSHPFSTIREGFFLLKAGLRKYARRRYRTLSRSKKGRELFLVGGWRDRYAGAHIHVSDALEPLTQKTARRLAWHLHDHIPLLIAVCANSPVWADEITNVCSNRVLGASRTYFRPIDRRRLTQRAFDEMLFSRERRRKPATLEIRICDSNVPEFVMTAACLVKAVALNRAEGGAASNTITKAAYLHSRREAAALGMRARLCWKGEWMSASRYLDRFIWTYRRQLDEMDVPDEIWTTFKLLKRKINGAAIIHAAARLAHAEHPQTWQRRFAKRYVNALDRLLSGDSILDFAERLHAPVPDVDEVWLGRRSLRLAG
ncbi:MAG: hypothetical protein JXO72_05485 [Vicinamibacteria bacterium]|nr:hypothetical protein [Vicinamibacteria bacterium]